MTSLGDFGAELKTGVSSYFCSVVIASLILLDMLEKKSLNHIHGLRWKGSFAWYTSPSCIQQSRIYVGFVFFKSCCWRWKPPSSIWYLVLAHSRGQLCHNGLEKNTLGSTTLSFRLLSNSLWRLMTRITSTFLLLFFKQAIPRSCSEAFKMLLQDLMSWAVWMLKKQTSIHWNV